MSLHVEWMNCENVGLELVGAGTEVGENEVDEYAVIFWYDEAIVLEGTLAELEAAGNRITDLAKRARLGEELPLN